MTANTPCARKGQPDCADGSRHPCKYVTCPRAISAEQAHTSAVREEVVHVLIAHVKNTKRKKYESLVDTCRADADAILARFNVTPKERS